MKKSVMKKNMTIHVKVDEIKMPTAMHIYMIVLVILIAVGFLNVYTRSDGTSKTGYAARGSVDLPSPWCENIDGKNKYQFGAIKGIDEKGNPLEGNMEEKCLAEKAILELWCQNNRPFKEEFPCEYGCSKGACIPPELPLAASIPQPTKLIAYGKGGDERPILIGPDYKIVRQGNTALLTCKLMNNGDGLQVLACEKKKFAGSDGVPVPNAWGGRSEVVLSDGVRQKSIWIFTKGDTSIDYGGYESQGIPQCMDGIDNDHDGTSDTADSDCVPGRARDDSTESPLNFEYPSIITFNLRAGVSSLPANQEYKFIEDASVKVGTTIASKVWSGFNINALPVGYGMYHEVTASAPGYQTQKAILFVDPQLRKCLEEKEGEVCELVPINEKGSPPTTTCKERYVTSPAETTLYYECAVLPSIHAKTNLPYLNYKYIPYPAGRFDEILINVNLVKTAQKCTEDDGGANFFKFSKTTDKSGLTREDWCYRASGQSAVGVTLLQERYCRSDGSMASPIVDCNDDPKSGYAPSGCKEKYNAASCACKAGACVPLIAIGK